MAHVILLIFERIHTMTVMEKVGLNIIKLRERVNDDSDDVEKQEKKRKRDSLIVMPRLDIIAFLYLMLS